MNSSNIPRRRTVLLLLGFAGLVIFALTVVRNPGAPLTPEGLAAARRLWQEKGPKAYALTYTIRRQNDSISDRYEVKVQAGQAVAAQVNGRQEPEDRLRHYGMDRLFDFLVDFQKFDADKSKQAPYVRAVFDESTGALRRYVRRVLENGQRVEINVETLETKEE